MIYPFPCLDSPLVLPIRLGWGGPLYFGAGRPPKWGEGTAETVKADWTPAMPFLPLSPLPLPSRASRAEGCRGSWQLLGEVSRSSLTLLSGTSFPSEEAAAAAAAAAVPALRVYIFFTKSSGIVILFFKTQRGKESCIICKQCIIGYVVQSLLYSGLSCSYHEKCLWNPPPPTSCRCSHCVPPPPSFKTVTKALLQLPASSLQPLMRPLLPAAILPPDPSAAFSLLLPQPSSHTGAH